MNVPTACYPENRIGAFDFYVATCTEPLWYGSADGQRACGDSWREVTEDLFLFSQEDPIAEAEITPYGYVANRPTADRDPMGLYRLQIVERYSIERKTPPGWRPHTQFFTPEVSYECKCTDGGWSAEWTARLRWIIRLKNTSRPMVAMHEFGHTTIFRVAVERAMSVVEPFEARRYNSETECELINEIVRYDVGRRVRDNLGWASKAQWIYEFSEWGSYYK